MTPLAILLCLPIAILNRWGRGEGNMPKWQWLAFMIVCGAVITIDKQGIIALALTYIIVAFAVPPTHALFSSVTGQPPGREDGIYFQWMQNLIKWINNKLPAKPIMQYWFRYGCIYGIIRGFLTWPGYLFLWGYTGNPWVMAVAVCQLSEGFLYNLFKNIPAGDVVMGVILWMSMAMVAV